MIKAPEIFPWTQPIQKILQDKTGFHFAKNIMFESQNDSLSPGWVSLWPAQLIKSSIDRSNWQEILAAEVKFSSSK